MRGNENQLRYDSASLRYKTSTPSMLVKSSADIWTSVLLEVHRVNPCPDVFEPGATPDQMIVVQTKGTQELQSFRSGQWRHAIYRPGTIGMTPPMSVSRLRRSLQRNAQPFEKINLFIPQGFFHEARDHYRRAGRPYRTESLSALGFNDPVVAQMAFALLDAMDAGAPDLYAQSASQWMAMHLLSAHSSWLEIHQDRRCPGVISDKRLARVIEYMSAHFAEALSLDNLASEASVSKFHFARLFRLSTGTTPHEYLIQLRMQAARSLLRTTDLQISEISRKCGFTSVCHFVIAFKTRNGVSPNNFRRNLSSAPCKRMTRVSDTPRRPAAGVVDELRHV